MVFLVFVSSTHSKEIETIKTNENVIFKVGQYNITIEPIFEYNGNEYSLAFIRDALPQLDIGGRIVEKQVLGQSFKFEWWVNDVENNTNYANNFNITLKVNLSSNIQNEWINQTGVMFEIQNVGVLDFSDLKKDHKLTQINAKKFRISGKGGGSINASLQPPEFDENGTETIGWHYDYSFDPTLAGGNIRWTRNKALNETTSIALFCDRAPDAYFYQIRNANGSNTSAPVEVVSHSFNPNCADDNTLGGDIIVFDENKVGFVTTNRITDDVNLTVFNLTTNTKVCTTNITTVGASVAGQAYNRSEAFFVVFEDYGPEETVVGYRYDESCNMVEDNIPLAQGIDLIFSATVDITFFNETTFIVVYHWRGIADYMYSLGNIASGTTSLEYDTDMLISNAAGASSGAIITVEAINETAFVVLYGSTGSFVNYSIHDVYNNTLTNSTGLHSNMIFGAQNDVAVLADRSIVAMVSNASGASVEHLFLSVIGSDGLLKTQKQIHSAYGKTIAIQSQSLSEISYCDNRFVYTTGVTNGDGLINFSQTDSTGTIYDWYGACGNQTGTFGYYTDATPTTTTQQIQDGLRNLTQIVDSHVEIMDGHLQGEYYSPIFNAGSSQQWNNISWTPAVPYQQELLSSHGRDSNTPSFGGIDTTELMVYYRFIDDDITDGGVVTDYSGKSNDGTSENSGGGLSMNSSNVKFGNGSMWIDTHGNEYVRTNFGDGQNMDNESISISLWINVNDTGGTSRVPFGCSEISPLERWYVGISASDHYGIGVDQSSGFDNFGGAVTFNTWEHIVFLANGTDAILYVNGEKRISKPYTGMYIADCEIGDDPVFSGVPASLFDEVSIFNRTLTLNEIQNLYQRGISQLNLSVRSCNDAQCDGETFTTYTNSTKSVLSESDNQYIQYRANLYSEYLNLSIPAKLFNVTIHYGAGAPAGNTTGYFVSCTTDREITSNVDGNGQQITIDGSQTIDMRGTFHNFTQLNIHGGCQLNCYTDQCMQ